jgi:two-component system, NtrC family, nitrogen regulation sensor histidine kinase NtrY
MPYISLRTQTFILLILLVLLATIPLVIYYVQETQGLSGLGTDPKIESSLQRSIDLASTQDDKENAATALKRYRQIKVLKDRIVSQVITFSIFYSIGVVFISLVLGYFLVSRITKPLKTLTEATQRLAHDELDLAIEAKGGGEITRLIASFNKMAHDLKTAREQRAIAERRATWQHVARTIAHEIKNPLTPIKLSTERMYEKFLNNSKDFPEVIKSTTNTVLNEINNLQKLVETFHRYAKFPDPVLASQSLEEIVREVASLQSSGKIPIETEIAPALPQISLDKGQIKEALANLIKNGIEAVEAVGRPGKITVKCVKVEKDICLSIIDNGCGISLENQKKLFQPYFTTKKHGNGIGLALTERIITLNGGKIACESTEGVGTTFTIILPMNSVTG